MSCSKKLLTYLAVTFSFLVSNKGTAQTLEQTFDFAQQMKHEGNYETAIKYYQRVSYFGGNYRITDCYISTADCYFLINDFRQAENFYELAYFSTENDSIKDLVLLSRSAIFIYEKKYLEALQELFNTSDDKNILRTKNIYLATAYYGLNRFSESEDALLKIENDSLVRNNLHKLFSKAIRVQKRNPKTARILSMMLPGLGQFYSGDIRDGINSLLITSAFMYLTLNTAIQYSLLEATSVLPWFSRYYMGGFKRAESIAVNRIEEKQYLLFTQIMKLVRDN